MAHSNQIHPYRIIRQTWITREDLRANRAILYVYGDNVAREGFRGLARQMRGEPNAHPISVSWAPHQPFTHATAEAAAEQIDADLDGLITRQSDLIVWPLMGLVPEFQEMPDELRAHLRQAAHKRFQLADPI
ncbi:MAG: hypothetical protein ABJH52_02885 [Henriciella sp.]